MNRLALFVCACLAALGAQLRTLRKTRDLTLEQLASRSGISAGLLSQMERGQGNPSFNTLVQVAHALSVPVASLFRAEASGSPVVRRAERRRRFASSPGLERERTEGSPA